MKKTLLTIALLALSPLATPAQDPVDWVNPETGWISHMLVPCFPTVQRPNAMLRFTAPASTFAQDRVAAFRLTQPAHRGAGAISFRPYAADEPFTWDAQRVTPYSYSVVDDAHDVTFALVPGEKAALVSLGWAREPAARLSVGREGEVACIGCAVRGFDVCGGAKVYFFGEFSALPDRVETGERYVLVRFRPEVREAKLRYGVSYVSCEQAERNLRAEIGDWSDERLKADARAAWNRVLGRIEVEGGTERDRRVFYTALWRCHERMVNVTEEGRCRGWDGEVHETLGRDRYTDDWIWDTFRAQHPLMAWLDPAAEADKLASYLAMAAETKEGWVPLFPSVARDGHNMNGFHPPAIFLDALVKGVTNVDYAAAYRALAHTERTSSRLPWYRGPRNRLDDFFDERGYYPALAPAADGGWQLDPDWPEGQDRYERRQAVAVTLAYSFDAWCLAELAKKFGTPEEVAHYVRQSRNYRNLWKADARFFHPKDESGAWLEIGDYRTAGGQGARDYYDENNAWTYLWDVAHDIPGLIELNGGARSFAARLDELLNVGYGRNRWEFLNVQPDATGMFGMLCMGNEPNFHVPYLYDYAGEPWKTQKLVRKLLKAWFRDDLMGVPGDEDGGGMSAFVVWSMMGLYPVTPGSGEYALGSPVFKKVVVRPEGGRAFTILAPETDENHVYVKSLTIGGTLAERPFIPHRALAAGQTLVCEMTERPVKSFGSPRLSYSVETPASKLFYACGEEAAFTVTARTPDGALATAGELAVTLDNFGPGTVSKQTVDLARGNPFTVRGALDEPGFLRLVIATPGTEAFHWSVGYEPEKLVKGSASPDDFDAFWQEGRARLAAEVPPDVRLERVDELCTADWDYYRLSLATFGRRVSGFMSVPTAPGKFPVNVQVCGAGFGHWTNEMAGRKDVINVFFGVFPFAPDHRWREHNLKAEHDALDAWAKAKWGMEIYPTGLGEGRTDSFYYPVILGIDRALDWVAAHPKADLGRFRYHGTSQGGGLGLALTALNRHFTRALFYVPAITDVLGGLRGRRSGWPYPMEAQHGDVGRIEAVKANAPYYDGANFARRITCPVRVVAGLADVTCAPSAVQATFNELASAERELVWVPGMGHGVFDAEYAAGERWLEADAEVAK